MTKTALTTSTKNQAASQQSNTPMFPPDLDLTNKQDLAGFIQVVQDKFAAIDKRFNNLGGTNFTGTFTDTLAANHTLVFTKGVLTSAS